MMNPGAKRIQGRIERGSRFSKDADFRYIGVLESVKKKNWRAN